MTNSTAPVHLYTKLPELMKRPTDIVNMIDFFRPIVPPIPSMLSCYKKKSIETNKSDYIRRLGHLEVPKRAAVDVTC